MDNKWEIIALLELIALILITGWWITTAYQNGKEIRQCNSELEITNTARDSLRNRLEICEDDFQQDELLITDLQGTFNECKQGWKEAIDGWDRCLRMLK